MSDPQSEQAKDAASALKTGQALPFSLEHRENRRMKRIARLSQGTLGYATKDNTGQLTLLRFDESLVEADVEISDDFYVLKADDAKKLLEPPRLDRLAISPAQVTLKPGEQASFTCSGVDQYGQPFTIGSTKWTATGGEVTGDGLYTAATDATGGLFTAKGESGGLEVIAEIRVAVPAGPGGGDGPDDDETKPHKKAIRWEGEVAPQKWMNFYTKVLSRFASNEGLKLKVSFEVPAEGEQGQAKADEARSGLKELGLDDDVQLG